MTLKHLKQCIQKQSTTISSISYDHRNEEYFNARGLVEKLTGIELTEIDASAVKSLEKKSKASGIL